MTEAEIAEKCKRRNEMEDVEKTNGGIDIPREMERLKKLKEEYAELRDKSRGKIVVNCAYWSQDGEEVRVDWRMVMPDDYDDYEHKMRMLASEMLDVQNAIARQREMNQYELMNKWKAEAQAKKEGGK